jgi:hypothetical protein
MSFFWSVIALSTFVKSDCALTTEAPFAIVCLASSAVTALLAAVIFLTESACYLTNSALSFTA